MACLRKCEDRSVQDHCDALARQVRTGLNEVFERLDVPVFAWGESSIFHIALGQRASNRSAEDLHTPEGVSTEFLKGSGGDALAQTFEVGMLLEGVHLFHSGGFFSTAHTSADVEQTIAATERVVGRMREQGLLG